MLLKSQTVDGKAGSFVEPLQPATGGFHDAEVRGEPGGGAGIRDRPVFKGGQRVQATGLSSIIVGD